MKLLLGIIFVIGLASMVNGGAFTIGELYAIALTIIAGILNIII